MRIRIRCTPPRWFRWEAAPLEQRVLLARILEAARGTAYYRQRGSPVPLRGEAGTEAPDAVLKSWPRVEWTQRTRRPEAFFNAAARDPGLNRFYSPVQPLPRTAVFLGGVAQCAQIRVFREDQVNKLERFRPEVIAAPQDFLQRLARLIEKRAISVPQIHRCLIAFTSLGGQAMDSEARDLLWRVFRVPLFEQVLGLDGETVAVECDAHAGLHVLPSRAIFERDSNGELLFTSLTDRRYPTVRLATGWTASLDRSPCGCGLSGARLTNLARIPAQPRVAAATA